MTTTQQEASKLLTALTSNGTTVAELPPPPLVLQLLGHSWRATGLPAEHFWTFQLYGKPMNFEDEGRTKKITRFCATMHHAGESWKIPGILADDTIYYKLDALWHKGTMTLADNDNATIRFDQIEGLLITMPWETMADEDVNLLSCIIFHKSLPHNTEGQSELSDEQKDTIARNRQKALQRRRLLRVAPYKGKEVVG